MDKTLAAAQIIATARRNRTRLGALSADIAPQDEAEGYRIQRAVRDLLLPHFGAMVGYKIGCTSAVMQQYLNIPIPAAAACSPKAFMTAAYRCHRMISFASASNARSRSGSGRICRPSQAPFTADSVARAIEAYHPAIEIVDERYVDWQSIGAPTLVADDFYAAGCVLGAPVARSAVPDLLKVVGRAIINDVEVSRGTGADVLGHPHNPLAWLANHLAAEGKGLRAGQIVLTGSLVKTIWLNAGDKVTMELSQLGTVHAAFS
jgi:2-keto-4-pentenoate hydratase